MGEAVDRADPAVVPTRYWHGLADGRVQCDLCPRHCRLREGQRGLCFVRAASGGGVVLTTYGRASGFCVDPVEKKPLNHFLPGSAILSFGTAGCSLTCRYCQNWSLSRARATSRLSERARPEAIAEMAAARGCLSVAFTYNEPTIFHEFAVDTARACRARGIRTVAVSSGWVEPAPRAEFFRWMDAANVDLKAFDDAFYRRLCSGALAPVLDTIRYIRERTDTWLELTTLLIPGENDGDAEIDGLSRWVVSELGPDVPLHFTAFHPSFRMLDHPPTPAATLRRARAIAHAHGVRFAYTGNVWDPDGQSTLCPQCGELLVRRRGYDVAVVGLQGGRCDACGSVIAGRWGDA